VPGYPKEVFSMKRLIALAALALTLTFAAACSPDDSGTGGSAAPVFESPNSLESPAMSSPGLESIAPAESPAAS
jgi:hypothetical protein